MKNEIIIGTGMRRRDKRGRFLILGIFVMVFLFTLLTQKYKDNNNEVEAASLAGFDPGYIISDYTMGNYNAMTEEEIQAFLSRKGNCRDTNIHNADYYPSVSYHIKDGHFVCLAEETFGEGMAYGDDAPDGETAAHIIYQAAQDYKINPQVLIVLLQKEQGLITDSWPNSRQYRSATGYGCPDTAPCNAEYYGFKNQVRKAAAMFRTVLDGGWTNYPLGENYIQYNPSASCGGSVVNIRNLATSALYRYTPYQPNEGALAAGYGTAYCGAYGNRNFYLYFEDWFGGISKSVKMIDMETPRYLMVKNRTDYYDLIKNKRSDVFLEEGLIDYYSDKTYTLDGRMCLRSESDRKAEIDRCVFYSDLEEVSWVVNNMEEPRYLEATDATEVMDITTRKVVGKPEKYEYYDQKIYLPDGDMCLKKSGEQGGNCVLFSTMEEVTYQEYDMETPRFLTPKNNDVEIINPVNRLVIGVLKKKEKMFFQKKILLFNGDICLLVGDDISGGCVRYSELGETWVEMERPREMRMIVDSYKVNAITMERDYGIYLSVGLRRKFLMKRYIFNDIWCLQTEYDYERGNDNCIVFRELGEI